MEIRNSFDVPLPPDEAWAALMDIEGIVPCMPGAALTGIVGKDIYAGKVSVRLGPVALAFAGQVAFESIDNANHRARAKAKGTDSKGRGGANATVDFQLLPSRAGSQVTVRTDLVLSGAVAQYGRASGMIQDVASHLIGQFAECLAAKLEGAGAASETTDAPPTPPAPAKPISGFSLLLHALANAIRRVFGGTRNP